MDHVLRAYIDLEAQQRDSLFGTDLLEMLEMIPSYYLTFYYNHERMLMEQQQGRQLRAEQVMEIERKLFELFARPETVEKPPQMAERGGSNYSTVAVRLIAAILEDSGETQILNVPNNGTFANLPSQAVIEVPCRVDALGAQPLPIAPLPLHVCGLVEAVKASEQLAIEAAITGDQRTALRALVAHPIVPSFGVARSLLAALLAENADYLPQFVLPMVNE
jgi:6-phospho-beta-glucosidase